MTLFALILLSNATLTVPCAIVGSSRVRLSSPMVTIADVVDDRCSALKAAPYLGRIGLLRLSRFQSQTRLTSLEIQRFVRQAVPGLKISEHPVRTIEIDYALSSASVSAPPSQSCYRGRVAIAKSAIVSHQNLVKVECALGQVQLPVRYDRQYGVTRSLHEAPAGAYFGAMTLGNLGVLGERTPVSFIVSVGSVTIERNGTLVQPGFNGKEAFVIDEGGQVISMKMLVANRLEVPK